MNQHKFPMGRITIQFIGAVVLAQLYREPVTCAERLEVPKLSGDPR